MSRKCAITCQAHKPWEWRQVARNTGLKCEKRQAPKSYKSMVAKKKAARKEPIA